MRVQWHLRASAVFSLSAGKRTETKFCCQHLSAKMIAIFFVLSAQCAAAESRGDTSLVLPAFVAIEIRNGGRKKLVVPLQNGREAAMVAGIEVFGVRNLRETFTFLTGENPLAPVREDLAAFFASHCDYGVDFADVRGQQHVKRAIEIAAAAGHGLLIVWSN
jgi:predicted ATPase with chaperone activity